MNILKTTTKGQITLPVKWRKRYLTNQYKATEQGDRLIIEPLDLAKLDDEKGWETVFSAKKHNQGKGVEVSKLLKILDKIEKEQKA